MFVDSQGLYAPQRMLESLAAGTGTFLNVELVHEGDTWKLGFAGGR
tara:strand:- start:2765 stop:2902 length:138 start_codon:yes stop_codon:yes gene_type:complete